MTTRTRRTSKSKRLADFVIPFPPCPASRPRVGRWGTYYGKTYKRWRKEADKYIPDGEPTTAPVVMYQEHVIAPPKTVVHKVPSGDVDNLAKGPMDRITTAGTIWEDDNQVVELHSTKRFTKENEEPHTRIKVYAL